VHTNTEHEKYISIEMTKVSSTMNEHASISRNNRVRQALGFAWALEAMDDFLHSNFIMHTSESPTLCNNLHVVYYYDQHPLLFMLDDHL